jgi:serine/threonine-protein kinase
MGSVWRAQHLGLDIPCAVKFIEGELAALPEAQARFEREAKAAAQLRSPHVVQILDHGVFEGTPYIAMELLEGEDLGKRLTRLGRLSAQDTHAIISQVCRALGKAHAAGIVHRDLKPDNIFIVRDDDREIVKVLDFGIAKSRANDLGGSSNTKTGAMLGTPYYMSPEQAQGVRQVDFRTDLWALAVICFQALTGRLPFESEALGDLLVRIIVSPLPVPSQFGPVPGGFDQWWLKAAARDPSDRYQSAKDFTDSFALVCGVSQASGLHPMPLDPRGQALSSPAFAVSQVGTGSPLSRTVDPAAVAGVPTKRSRMIVASVISAAAIVTLGAGGLAAWGVLRPGAASTAAGAPQSTPPRSADKPADLPLAPSGPPAKRVDPPGPMAAAAPSATPAVTPAPPAVPPGPALAPLGTAQPSPTSASASSQAPPRKAQTPSPPARGGALSPAAVPAKPAKPVFNAGF